MSKKTPKAPLREVPASKGESVAEKIESEAKRDRKRTEALMEKYGLSESEASAVVEIESMGHSERPLIIQGYMQALVNNSLPSGKDALEGFIVSWVQKGQADPLFAGSEALCLLAYMMDTIDGPDAEVHMTDSMSWRIKRLLSPWLEANVRSGLNSRQTEDLHDVYIGFVTNDRIAFMISALLDTGMYGKTRGDVIERLVSESVRREIERSGILSQVVAAKAYHEYACEAHYADGEPPPGPPDDYEP